jgi:hypothetical protein
MPIAPAGADEFPGTVLHPDEEDPPKSPLPRPLLEPLAPLLLPPLLPLLLAPLLPLLPLPLELP